MKKILWVLVVLHPFLPIYGQQKATQSKSSQDYLQGVPSSFPSTNGSVPSTVVSGDSPTSKVEEQRPKDEPKSYLGTLIAPNNLPNLLLVAIGIGGIVVAWRNVSATRVAAEATRDAALATVKQAKIARQALVLQFRPRIIVRGGGITKQMEVLFQMTNTGGAIANVTFFNLTFYVVTKGEEVCIDGLPNQVEGESVFQPGEMKIHRVPLDDAVIEAISRQRTEPYVAPQDSPTLIYCVGIIRYRYDLKIERMTGLFRKHKPWADRFDPVPGSDAEYAD